MQSTQQALTQAIEVQRVRCGITKGELAHRAGYGTPSSLSKRLSGLVPIDMNDVEHIASALGVDPFDLMDLARSERGHLAA